MGEQTGISWCHATLNFWVGCTKVSTGDAGACEHCYAETWAKRWPAYRDTWGVGAARVRFKDTRAKALKLERLAMASAAPFYCFSNSLSDIFDNEVPIAWLAEAFADMRAAPHVTFLLLTKRAPNIVKRVEAAGGLPPNAALMITVVTQPEADRDIRHLLEAKALLKPLFVGVSMEPLMGPVNIEPWLNPDETCIGCDDGQEGARNRCARKDIPRHEQCPKSRAVITVTEGERDAEGVPEWVGCTYETVDWVITGGESGLQARPTHPDWLRAIRDQCAAAGVPYHHKQNGEWLAGHQYTRELQALDLGDVFSRFGCMDWDDAEAVDGDEFDLGEHAVYRVGKKRSGRLLDGVLHDAMPRVRDV